MLQISTWVCTRRQGRYIGGGSLSNSDGDWPDRGREDGLMLLSHYFGRPPLGNFSDDRGFLFGGSQSGFVLGVEGILV